MRDRRQNPRVSARRASRDGYTLVELMMVVVVIGIATAMALPRLNTSGMRVDAAVRDVRGTLQVAQRTAVMRQFDVIVSVDVANAALRVVEDRNNNAAIDADERTRWVRLEPGNRFTVPPAGVTPANGALSAVRLSQPRTIDGLPSIIFRRHGAASSNAEIFVQGVGGRDSDFRAVTVVQATGRAEWYRRDGAWKKVGA
jgi:prepilin-type N-terminal cleavage/methylation domain-containing protein